MGTTPPRLDDVPDFGSFKPTVPVTPTLRQEDFAGLSIEACVERYLAFLATRKVVREVTREMHAEVLRLMLRMLGQKGLTLATVTPENIAELRAWLQARVDAPPQCPEVHNHTAACPKSKRKISENTASMYVRTWNSIIHCLFGEDLKPGESLAMRGFKQTPRGGEPLSNDEMEAMLLACDNVQFRCDHNRRAFRVYLQLARCVGPRIGSVLKGRIVAKHIDWKEGRIFLGHMKNKKEHWALLTDQALVSLYHWFEYLEAKGPPFWRGGDSIILIEASGKSMHREGVNKTLRRVAAAAGIQRRLTSHIFRKTVGTVLSATVGAKAAADQLGNNVRTINTYYNLPTWEHRVKARPHLPGADWKPQTEQEFAAIYAIQFRDGKIGATELSDRLRDLKTREALTEDKTRGVTPGYG